jgi:hypothetical protein
MHINSLCAHTHTHLHKHTHVRTNIHIFASRFIIILIQAIFIILIGKVIPLYLRWMFELQN